MAAKTFIRRREEVLAGRDFSLIVDCATFVSNDKVNERIFQREPALPECLFFLFQRLDKLEQFGKRPQAC